MSIDPTVIAYWQEFRKRALVFICCFLIAFLFSYIKASYLYDLFSEPLKQYFGIGLVAFSLTDVFLPPLQMAWYTAWFISMPVLLYQVYAFFAPALYQSEKALLRVALVASVGLFYLGFILSLLLIPPILLHNVQGALASNVQYIPNIRLYTDFMLSMSFSFGVFFELPLLMFLMNVFGWVQLSSILALRRYFFLIAFIVGMLITPPDVLSQCLVAIPLCAIFECGLLTIRGYRFVQKRRASSFMLTNCSLK